MFEMGRKFRTKTQDHLEAWIGFKSVVEAKKQIGDFPWQRENGIGQHFFDLVQDHQLVTVVSTEHFTCVRQ